MNQIRLSSTSVYKPQATQKAAEKGILAPTPGEDTDSTLSAAQEALASAVGETESLQDTMEGMSLNLGSRFQSKLSSEAAKQKRTRKAITRLVHQQLTQGQLGELLEPYEEALKEKGNLQQILSAEGLSQGGKVLVLSGLLEKDRLSPEQALQSKKQLETLTQDGSFIVEAFAFLNLKTVDTASLAAMRTLYQQAMDYETNREEGLTQWFTAVAQWPNREEKLKCLLASLGFELSVQPSGDQAVHIASVMNDLSRISLFLSVQSHTTQLANGLGISKDTVLFETLNLLDQHWVYPEWINDRIQALGLSESEQTLFLKGWQDIVALLPPPCFREETQQQQVLGVFEELQAATTTSQM